ncbi:MAG: type III-B CRISPR module RAMP protein Cmr1 [Acidobacteriota bacterium]
MKRVSYETRFLTPGFIGGSDQTKAELTANGIRGQLRWWFRAVAGGRFAGDLVRVSRLETRLFGATEHQSALRVVVTKQPQRSMDAFPRRGLDASGIASRAGLPPGAAGRLVITKDGREVPTNAIAYLGFGPVSWNGTTARQYAVPGESSSFFIQYRGLDIEAEEILSDTVWAWMNLGAIGSRARRGYGSFSCTSVERTGNLDRHDVNGLSPVCADTATFEAGCLALFARNVIPGHTETPEWSHFSANAAVFRAAEPMRNWADAMTAAAAWLIAFRRRYGMGTGADYDWLKASTATGMPHRSGFGLPLPFGKGDDLIVNWGGGRRASPLLLRIANFGEDFYPVFTHLPARFLPPRASMRFRRFSALPSTAHTQIVSDFLAELANRGRIARIV